MYKRQGVDNAVMATRVRAEKAEGALRRQGGRLVRISWGELECSDVMAVWYADHPTIMTKGNGVFSSCGTRYQRPTKINGDKKGMEHTIIAV